MYKFSEFITERFVNLFPQDKDLRLQYADEVWEYLQMSYKKQGGIKGKGFNSKEDMVNNIPFWKLVRKNGQIVAGAFYKDKGGRKRVASFTNRTPEGVEALGSIVREDFDRAYFEISKGSLKLAVGLLGYDFIIKYAKTPEEVKTILKGKEILPVEKDDSHVAMYGKLKNYFYQRELDGDLETKIMLGTTGKKIITDF